jgi:hypothetical protein
VLSASSSTSFGLDDDHDSNTAASSGTCFLIFKTCLLLLFIHFLVSCGFQVSEWKDDDFFGDFSSSSTGPQGIIYYIDVLRSWVDISS